MQEKKRITILIPTHNRHIYLRRILNYYDKEAKIVVADSSAERFDDKIANSVSYEYYGGFSFFEKMYAAINLIETEYTVICADDDFIVPSAIDKCIAYMDENNKCVACEGNAIIFKHVLGMLISSPYVVAPLGSRNRESIGFVDFFGKTVYSDFPRANNHFYSVFRTSILKEYFTICLKLSKEIDNMRALELLLVVITMARGDKIFLDIFYTAKEIIESSGSATIDDIQDISDKDWAVLEEFLKKYFISLGHTSEISSIAAKEMVPNLKGVRNNIRQDGQYRMIKYILNIKVFTVLKSLRYTINASYKILQTYKIQGFPYFFHAPRLEWERIQKHIKLHHKEN